MWVAASVEAVETERGGRNTAANSCSPFCDDEALRVSLLLGALAAEH